MNRRNVFATLAAVSLLASPALASTEYTPHDDTRYPASETVGASSPSAPAAHDWSMAYDDVAYPLGTPAPAPEPGRQAPPSDGAPAAPMLACACQGR